MAVDMVRVIFCMFFFFLSQIVILINFEKYILRVSFKWNIHNNTDILIPKYMLRNTCLFYLLSISCSWLTILSLVWLWIFKANRACKACTVPNGGGCMMTAWAWKRFLQHGASRKWMLSPSSSDLLPGLLVAKRNEKSENTEHLLT